MADTWYTKFGGAAKADSRQTPGRTYAGHIKTRFGGAAKIDSRQTRGRHMRTHAARGSQSGLKTNTRDKRRIHGGHEADKLWGRGQGISRPAFFS